MKLLKIVFFVFLFTSCVAKTKQENFRKHIVGKGETVYQIAKQYQVTPFDIYRLNPDAKDGIQENATLLIPKLAGKNFPSVNKTVDSVKKHKVEPKETLYSIAKMYEVSIADLKEWNQELLNDGLKTGHELIVSSNYKPINNDYIEVEKIKNTSKVFSHKVLPQETKFGIAKKYEITIEQLEKWNPQIVENGLQIGEVLKLKDEYTQQITQVNKEEKFYTVKPKETLFTITKYLNISQEDLYKLNPELENGLKEGMVLKLPSSFRLLNESSKKEIVDLLPLVKKDKKRNLVLLLPFNINKMDSDSTKTYVDFIKERNYQNFLNLTLDFYSGAVIAIDSAKALGLPVHIDILDVESSRSSSNVAQLISKKDFSKVDAVIGPFMYSHVENTAQLLSKYKTPVISPLSKEIGAPLENLYYAMPSSESMIKEVFAYMEKKAGNVVAVISGKKSSTKEHLVTNYPNVKYPNFTDKGALDVESLKGLLVKGQKNFVILETEKAALILHTTKALKKFKEEFDIQLVVLELYETLDFEEIPISNLMELNMLFPSYKREVDSEAGKIFEKKYKNLNNVAPNAYATKGFDVTFDTLLRICQEEGFSSSIKTNKTEQVESSFDYITVDGRNINSGIYIMCYDTDFSIKQAE